jgi:uncharacterized membrane protein (UPF0182 family)
VTDPQQFYSGQDFWQVPFDPASNNSTTSGNTAAANVKQAPYYLLAKFPQQNQTTFQLTTAMTPRGRQNLVSLITGSYVDGQPRLEVLKLPDDTQVPGPGQADQKMTNDNAVRPTISQTKISATLLPGNLLSLPVGGGMLYVEPLYVQSSGVAYPQLKYVLVNFGQFVGFDPTLQGALKQLLTAAGGQAPTSVTPPPGNTTQPSTNPAVAAAIDKINKAVTDLKAAQQSGDFAKYGQALQALQAAIAEYEQAKQAAGAQPSGSPTPSGSPSGSLSPSPAG